MAWEMYASPFAGSSFTERKTWMWSRYLQHLVYKIHYLKLLLGHPSQTFFDCCLRLLQNIITDIHQVDSIAWCCGNLAFHFNIIFVISHYHICTIIIISYLHILWTDLSYTGTHGSSTNDCDIFYCHFQCGGRKWPRIIPEHRL